MTDRRVKITEHFRLREFDRPRRRGLPAAHYPDEWIDSRLYWLCTLLEEIRARIGKPIKVLSAYRDPAYNRLIGSRITSQHVQGRAVDIAVKDMSSKQLHDRILKAYRDGEISGIGGLGLYRSFVHVDTRHRSRLARWRGSRVSN